MHLRPLLSSDIPTLSILAASAFSPNDELFAFLNPHSTAHPQDFRDFFLRRLRYRTTQPSNHTFVAVSDPSDADWLPSALSSPETLTPFGRLGAEADSSGEVLLGYVMWKRYGDSRDPLVSAWRNNTDLWTRLNHALRSLEQDYCNVLRLDGSADYDRKAAFAKTITAERRPQASDEEQSKRGYWHLSVLATSPIARRRGVGRMLTEWGVQRAREEHVPVNLNSSDVGVGLYESMGFRTVEFASEQWAGRRMVWQEST
ncbi:MAG: hypothetical protein Q9162_002778 [Coniocarpon cinnabarinum]